MDETIELLKEIIEKWADFKAGWNTYDVALHKLEPMINSIISHPDELNVANLFAMLDKIPEIIRLREEREAAREEKSRPYDFKPIELA